MSILHNNMQYLHKPMQCKRKEGKSAYETGNKKTTTDSVSLAALSGSAEGDSLRNEKAACL